MLMSYYITISSNYYINLLRLLCRLRLSHLHELRRQIPIFFGLLGFEPRVSFSQRKRFTAQP